MELYNIKVKSPFLLADKDYRDTILLRLYKYSKNIDISNIYHPYYQLCAVFNSQKQAETFCKENLDLIDSVHCSPDQNALVRIKQLYTDTKLSQ
jgi:hypothetical protein